MAAETVVSGVKQTRVAARSPSRGREGDGRRAAAGEVGPFLGASRGCRGAEGWGAGHGAFCICSRCHGVMYAYYATHEPWVQPENVHRPGKGDPKRGIKKLNIVFK